jgi:AcrR family transcriptional regulator
MDVIVDMARASHAFEAAERGSTRDRLICTAERLFAERGVEGVSLRAICVEAGQGNTRALQYHFGDRSGIVGAILLTRMAWIETRRAALLEAVYAQQAEPDVGRLMEVLLRPISETLDPDGRNVYARFLAQILTHTHYWSTSGPAASARTLVTLDSTATERVLAILARRLPFLTPAKLSTRMSHVLRMFLGAVIDRENTLLEGGEADLLERTIREQFEMAAAAIGAPA